MAPDCCRIFLLGILFVSAQSQSVDKTVSDTSTSNTEIPNPQTSAAQQTPVNKAIDLQGTSKQDARPSDIPTDFLASDPSQQPIPTAEGSGSFTPIGFTGLGVPAAWQVQQPGSDQVQQIASQPPAQLPGQVPIQLPEQIPVKQSQPQPEPTEPAAVAPEPQPGLFGGEGLGGMGGMGAAMLGGGDLFGGMGGDLGGGMGLFGGSGTSGTGGGLFGGSGGGSGGMGGGNILQTMMLMRMLGVGADAPDPPARPRGRGARGQGRAQANQLSPIQQLALMELRRLMGVGPPQRPGMGGRMGPGPNRNFGPGPNMGPGPNRRFGPPQRDYPPTFGPPNNQAGEYNAAMETPVVRGPPPPSFRGGRPPFRGQGQNGIPPPPPTHGSRIARSMHSSPSISGSAIHPEILSGKFLKSTANPNNQGQGPEPVETEPPQPQEGAKATKKAKTSTPRLAVDVNQKQLKKPAGVFVDASNTQFRVFVTQEPPTSPKSTFGKTNPSVVPTISSQDANSNAMTSNQQMQGTASVPFDISPSRNPKISVNIPADMSVLQRRTERVLDPAPTQGDIINPRPTQTGFPSEPSTQFSVSPTSKTFQSSKNPSGSFGGRDFANTIFPTLSSSKTSSKSVNTRNQRIPSQRDILQLLSNPLVLRTLRLSGRTSPLAVSGLGMGNADMRADRADRMADMMDNLQAMSPMQRMMIGAGGIMGGMGAMGSGIGSLLSGQSLLGGGGQNLLGGGQNLLGGGQSLLGGGQSLLGGTSSGQGSTGRNMDMLAAMSTMGGTPNLGGSGIQSTTGSNTDILSMLLGTTTSPSNNALSGLNNNNNNRGLGSLGETSTSNRAALNPFGTLARASSSGLSALSALLGSSGGLGGRGGLSPLSLLGMGGM